MWGLRGDVTNVITTFADQTQGDMESTFLII